MIEQQHELKPLKRPVREHPILELLKFAAIAMLIVIPIRLFIAQPFIVNGSSMVPTFGDGDYLIVDEISYRFKEPERGDVIIFRFPNDPSKFFIKRIIGLPSETIEIKGHDVFIYNEKNPKGEQLYEPYVVYPSENQLKIKLDSDKYFVMGDNRAQSSDSRVWGPMPRNFLVGQAFLRLLPVMSLGYLPGDIRP